MAASGTHRLGELRVDADADAAAAAVDVFVVSMNAKYRRVYSRGHDPATTEGN